MLQAMLVWIAAAALGEGARSARCSMTGIPETNSPDAVYFLGYATTDTVAASSGTVKAARGSGHYGAGRERAIYGQRFVIRRIGRPWKELFKSPPTEGILVPWDYDAGCQPTYWSRSARWATPGDPGLVRARLREERHWMNGTPTFDVFTPAHTPYPNSDGAAMQVQSARRRQPGRVMTPEELMELIEVLPMGVSYERRGEFDASAARRWEATNPELATSWPAADLLQSIAYLENLARVARIDPPIVGTYRVVVVYATGDSTVVYLRSEQRASSGLDARTRADIERGRTGAIGYYLWADGASAPDAFDREPAPRSGGYLAIALEPSAVTADSSVWRGDIDVANLVRQLESRPLVQSEAVRVAKEMNELRDPEWFFLPGRWITYRDGRVRYEWEGKRGDRVVVTIRVDRLPRS